MLNHRIICFSFLKQGRKIIYSRIFVQKKSKKKYPRQNNFRLKLYITIVLLFFLSIKHSFLLRTLQHINYYTAALKLFSGLLIYCLVIFIAAKPLFKIVSDWAEEKYEVCENFEECDAEEKEKLEDKKEKEHEYYSHPLIGTYTYWEVRISKNSARRYFDTHQLLSESYLGIFLPPPEVC